MALVAGPASPAFAQEAKTAPEAQKTMEAVPALSLQLSKHDFSRGPRALPNLFNPYKPLKLEEPSLVNSPRLEQLIRDGKLELGLQDAIELVLENNLEIVVQRYNPWIADTDILRTKGGGAGRGLAGTGTASALGSIPVLNFDPTLTSTFSFENRHIPVNNPLTSGVGTSASAAKLITHSSVFNTQYSQGFATGTGVAVSWNNTRNSSTSAVNLFNPSVQSSIFLSIQQQLLNGFGLLPNTRFIRIAKNNRKIADLVFQQQAITTITNAISTYWELVFARGNVKVQERAVAVAEKLYGDNKKQVEIGTMAPIDVVRAESEVAANRQNLIVAQTVLLQQQQVLKNAISKNPLDPKIVNLEIIPTDQPGKMEQPPAISFEDALREALQNRPDIRQQEFNLKNADINVRATRNALLPVASVTAQYGTFGLSGNSVTTPPPPAPPVIVRDGLGGTLSQAFQNTFPDYALLFNVSVPLRNRQAQADNQRAILTQRQLEAQIQQLKNAALLDVRNAFIILEQDQARLEAASKARILQEQTFDAEQKKYQLGASTVFLVIQTQRDLTTAQGNELRAQVDLVKAKADYERALGRTLNVHRVTVADIRTGDVEQEALIPGTLHGEVVGAPKSY